MPSLKGLTQLALTKNWTFRLAFSIDGASEPHCPDVSEKRRAQCLQRSSTITLSRAKFVTQFWLGKDKHPFAPRRLNHIDEKGVRERRKEWLYELWRASKKALKI